MLNTCNRLLSKDTTWASARDVQWRTQTHW